MNIGVPEFGILGFIALIFFGVSKLPKKPEKNTAKKEAETNPMASFQNNNSDFDNTPINKPEA